MDHRQAVSLLEIEGPITLDTLKESFKKQAFRYHPDRNKCSDAPKQFQLRLEAYQFLEKELTSKRSKGRPQSSVNKQKRVFHRPIVDPNSEIYQKIRNIGAIIFGKDKVEEVEGTLSSASRSLDDIFDLLGIEK
jgi:DnaJ-class molecular chaperone